MEYIEKSAHTQKENPKPKPTIRQFTTRTFSKLEDAVNSLSEFKVPRDIIDLHLKWSVDRGGNSEREYTSTSKKSKTKYFLTNTKKTEWFIAVIVIENCDYVKNMIEVSPLDD